MADKTERDTESVPAPDRKVGDRGLAKAKRTSTTEDAPDSALGGKTATRSGVKPHSNPAEQRSSRPGA